MWACQLPRPRLPNIAEPRAPHTSKDHTQIRPNRRHGATSDEARLTSETAEVIIEALARAA